MPSKIFSSLCLAATYDWIAMLLIYLFPQRNVLDFLALFTIKTESWSRIPVKSDL